MGSSYTPPVNLASPGTIGGTTPGAATFTTLTANTSLVINGGSAITSDTGTGALVRATGATITTPTVSDYLAVASFIPLYLYYTGNTGSNFLHLGNGASQSISTTSLVIGELFNWQCAKFTASGVEIIPVLYANSGIAIGVAKVGGKIFESFADVSTTHTDGTEDDLYSYTTAAGQLAANGQCFEQIEHVSFVSSATAARRLKKYFGGTLIFDSGSLTLTLGGEFDVYTVIVRETSSVVRCTVMVTSTSASTVPYSTYTRITGLTLSSTNILKTTGISSGTGAAASDIATKLSAVFWYPSSLTYL